ncbi:MAG: hypothetical protein C4586_08570 [Anaerolineaceae bacterium]|nr:MAG: hypothetical protein C4586_08570 [Anaerolineaceae bacterium]
MAKDCDDLQQYEKTGPPVSFRVHPDVKKQFDSLPKEIRIRAYERMRVEVARAIHEATFKPYDILYPTQDGDE